MTTPRSRKFLALRTRFHSLLERAILIGAQFPDPETVDDLDPDDTAWAVIEMLLREFHEIQDEMNNVIRLAKKLQQLN
jgi:hypothetical protein